MEAYFLSCKKNLVEDSAVAVQISSSQAPILLLYHTFNVVSWSKGDAQSLAIMASFQPVSRKNGDNKTFLTFS